MVQFLNAFWHGNEIFPKGSFQYEIVPLLVVFHLPYSKYKGVKIRFYPCRYQNQNFSVESHMCRLCSTCVALVLLVSHSCRQCHTRVTFVSIVSHSCHSCLALVLQIRLDQVYQLCRMSKPIQIPIQTSALYTKAASLKGFLKQVFLKSTQNP